MRVGAPEEAAASPVRVLAPTDRVSVREGAPATLPLRVEIDPGFHVNAHEPGVEGLIPLEVRIEGSRAVRVAVEYPAGTPYRGAAVAPDVGTLLVHEGAVELANSAVRLQLAAL